MGRGNPRDSRKEQAWRRTIREWRRSGLNVRAFCAARGLAEASLYAWRRELVKRDAENAGFVPVQVVAVAPAPDAALVVTLDGGRTIRVSPGFDATTLRQLLAVLEARPLC